MDKYWKVGIWWATFVQKKVISHFSRHNSSVFLFSQTLHTIYKSSPSKCKFSDYPLLWLKFTKFLMWFSKKENSVFFSEFGSFFIVMRNNSSVHFYLKLYMLLTKVLHQSEIVQTCIEIHQVPNVIFWTKRVSFSSNFSSLFHVMRCNSSVLFHLNLYMLWTKGGHQSTNF